MKKTILLSTLLLSSANASGPKDYNNVICKALNQDAKSLQEIPKESQQFINFLGECKSPRIEYSIPPLKAFSFEAQGQRISLSYITSPHGKLHQLSNSKFSRDKYSLRQKEVISGDKRLQTFVISKKGTEDEVLPTVLIRTPYLLYGPSRIGLYAGYADLGYHVVLQAMAGTFNSTGTFKWLDLSEVEDSKSTIDWIVDQKWSNKSVVGVGVSYPGFGSLTAAAVNHPNLISVISGSAPVSKDKDSLSNGSSLFSAMDYTQVLNRQLVSVKKYGTFDNRNMSYYSSLYTGGVNHKEFDKKYYSYVDESYRENLEILRTGKRLTDNQELIDALKKSSTPVIHLAGVKNDQDNMDSIRTFKRMENKSNHYLMVHSDGHHPAQNINTILNLGNTLSTKEEWNELFHLLNGEKKISWFDTLTNNYEYTNTIEELERTTQKIELHEVVEGYYRSPMLSGVQAINGIFKLNFDYKLDKKIDFGWIGTLTKACVGPGNCYSLHELWGSRGIMLTEKEGSFSQEMYQAAVDVLGKQFYLELTVYDLGNITNDQSVTLESIDNISVEIQTK